MIRRTKAEYRAGAFNPDDSVFILDRNAKVKRKDAADEAWIQCWIRILSGETPKINASAGCEFDQDTGYGYPCKKVHLRERAAEMGIK
jgi:hypothetical protein